MKLPEENVNLKQEINNNSSQYIELDLFHETLSLKSSTSTSRVKFLNQAWYFRRFFPNCTQLKQTV